MRIGVLLPHRGVILQSARRPPVEDCWAIARLADAADMDVWVGDSVVAKPRLEPLTTLAYVAAITKRSKLGTAILLPALHQVHLNTPVQGVRRLADGRVAVQSPRGEETFDAVVMASHSDQSLALLQDASALERTLLADGASLGLHESQSRLWENLVGRSRAAWSAWFPVLRSTFPAQFNGVLPEEFYRAINVVRPSFIRVEADELTYVLHVILRFELEQEMLDGRLALCDLPAAWITRMRDYLGIDVPDDAQGCLQDVHWSAGYIGYFPTYAIGSVISAQLWNHAMASDAALADACGRGEYEGLAAWLRQAVHRHGRKFPPRETLERAIGDGSVDPEPYLAYLTKKYSDIYGLTDATHGHN